MPVVWRSSPDIPLGSWLAVPGPSGDAIAVGVVSVEPREIHPRAGVLGIVIDEGDGGPRIVQIIPDSGAAEAGL